jgi:hypothetical protein
MTENEISSDTYFSFQSVGRSLQKALNGSATRPYPNTSKQKTNSNNNSSKATSHNKPLTTGDQYGALT